MQLLFFIIMSNTNSFMFLMQQELVHLRTPVPAQMFKNGLLVLHPFLVEAEQSVETKHGPTEVTLGIIALSKDFWCSWESNGMFLEMFLLHQHHCAGEIGCCPLPSWNGFTPVISVAGSEGCSSSPSSKAHRRPNDMMSY